MKRHKSTERKRLENAVQRCFTGEVTPTQKRKDYVRAEFLRKLQIENERIDNEKQR